MRRFIFLLLVASILPLVACSRAGDESGGQFSPEMNESIRQQNEKIFAMFDGHGIYHTETGYVGKAADMPKNREQLMAGDQSNLLQLRDPDPRFFAYFPDVPKELTANSYMEELATGKRVDAFIMVAEGFGFVAIEPAEALSAGVIYCLPAELSRQAEASRRCFVTD